MQREVGSRELAARQCETGQLLTGLRPLPYTLCAQEAFNDALYFKDEALRAFKLGILSLEERAQVPPLPRA